ncbi:hypothetical protein F5877DRAFT_73380, partial [Lentinula edodes]
MAPGYSQFPPRFLFQAGKTRAVQLEDKIKDLEEKLASKDLHTQKLNSTIELLEKQKRQLEETAAIEKPQSEADRNALKYLRDEAKAGKTQAGQLEEKIKELETSLVSKDSYTQKLNTTIKLLETEKRRLEETAATEKISSTSYLMIGHLVELYLIQPQIEANRVALKKLREETKAEKTRVLRLEDNIKDLEEKTAATERPQSEADRVALKKLRDEAKAGKTQTGRLEEKIKDLETTLASKDSNTQKLNSTIELLETERRRLEENAATEKPQIEVDRASLKQLRDESKAWKTQASKFENKIKDLYTSLASKDAHTQTLNSTIQLLETEKRRLETNAAAEKPQIDADRAALEKFRNKNNESHTQMLIAKIRALEIEKRNLEETVTAERPQNEADRAALCRITRELDVGAARIRELEQRIKDLQTLPSDSEMEKTLAENALLKSSVAQERNRLLAYQADHVTKARFETLERDYYHLQAKLQEKVREIVFLKQSYETEKETGQFAEAQEIQPLRDSLAKLQAQHEEDKLANSSAQTRLLTLESQIAIITRERDELNRRVLANGNVSNLEDTITKLREQYEREALSLSQKQGRVTALEQQVADLIWERDFIKESSENGPLISQIEKLKAERDRYKDELDSQSAGHHFLSSRKNRTLSRAN